MQAWLPSTFCASGAAGAAICGGLQDGGCRAPAGRHAGGGGAHLLALLGGLAHQDLRGARTVGAPGRMWHGVWVVGWEKVLDSIGAATPATMPAAAALYPCPPPPLYPPLLSSRLHFMTNLGVAGGLLLLSTMGAGRFAVDALLPKKRE